MVDLKDLERFQHEATNAVKAHAIQPFDPTGLAGRILAFDQSLANTGWALIDGGLVTHVGNIKTEAEGKGPEDTFKRGLRVYMAVDELMRWYLTESDTVAHEMPAVARRAQRPEASYVAAMAIRAAAHNSRIGVEMVNAQHAKKRWTGSAKADKSVVKTALLNLHPYMKDLRPMNQAITDAIALGLVVAEKQSMERL